MAKFKIQEKDDEVIKVHLENNEKFEPTVWFTRNGVSLEVLSIREDGFIYKYVVPEQIAKEWGIRLDHLGFLLS
jgi:hypothetical protein